MSRKVPQQSDLLDDMIPTPWRDFMRQMIKSNEQGWSKFPKKQLLKFSQTPSSPKIKQLLPILPIIHRKYEQNCEYFRQLIILLYLLVLKGCVNTSQQLVDISMSVLEQLLAYRLIIVCSMTNKHSVISQTFDYMQNWLNLLVPAILANSSMQFGKQKDRKKVKDKASSKQQNNKSFITILYSLNKKHEIKPNKMANDCTANAPMQNKLDSLLVVFQALLVAKIRNHLTYTSLFQFDSVMRKLYSADKFKMIYQGRGCVSHLTNKEKQKKDKQKQLTQSSYISVSGLVPARLNELSWQVYDLQFQTNLSQSQNIQGRTLKQKQPLLKLKKVPSQNLAELPPWVVDAFKPNSKPNPIKITFKIMLNKMKALQMYKFLYLLQIYGSSPNIQQLNQYIPDDNLITFFTKFLLGDNLLVSYFEIQGNNKENKKMSYNSQYNYKNDKLCLALQKCLNETYVLQTEFQKSLFIEQFKNKLIYGHIKNNRIKQKVIGRQNNGKT